jgi:hypothetical protein
MTLCEFCVLQQADGSCSNGHTTPKKMRCVDFAPGIERFCSTPADYVGQEQLKQMALFFGLAGKELKRVLEMSKAARRSEATHDLVETTTTKVEKRSDPAARR